MSPRGRKRIVDTIKPAFEEPGAVLFDTPVTSLPVEPLTRRGRLRECLLQAITKLEPELERSFDMQKIIDLPGTRGRLRDVMPDFKLEDKKLFQEVLNELKEDGTLFHKNRQLWARMK